jgi:hypothetical protein
MKKRSLLIPGIFLAGIMNAQNAQDDGKVEVLTPISFHITKPLSEIAAENPFDEDEYERGEAVESSDRLHRQPQTFLYTFEKDGPAYGNDPATIQSSGGTRMLTPPIVNFAGQSGGGSCPPDPSGAAGPNHYVQSVNATPVKIYSKTGTTVLTIAGMGSLWSPAVGNMGDPIIMYDRYADRWFISQFGQSGGTNYIYIGISQTANPAGAYYTYTYTSSQFPDYLKFSVWADGYYMSSNQSTDKMFVFERDQMLLGNPSARSINKTFATGSVSGFFVPLPADADGGLPPLGTPLPFFSYYENSWGGGVDAIKIWSMTTTWGTTPTATITTTPTSVPTAAFDGTYDPSWNDIQQASGTQKLDGIGGVLTYRAQWRKWTGYNSVVLNWGVKVSSTQRSIKWVELRQNQTTGVWSLYQEGIYAPDALNRWVGSIAMDDNGSIGLCYAVAGPSPSTSPSLRYTGRLATDPLGQMTFTEQTAIAGSGVMTACGNRFGDYSQTSLDPDGITFWHTGEYITTGSPRTRIYSFQLPLPTGINDVAGTVQLNVSISGNELIVKGGNLNSDEETVVDLFDISGRQISGKKVMPSGNSLQTSFDISTLSEGTYLVRIGRTGTNFQKVSKVVITK